MLTSIHILLTYACTFACDHCFVYGSPRAKGTLTIGQVEAILREAANINGITEIYFEGGEPTQYFATLCASIRCARELGFSTGIVTNAHWAISDEDAELCLRMLRDAGLTQMDLSDGELHFGDARLTPARRALAAAERLGLPAGAICRKRPVADSQGTPDLGGIKFRGRAADLLAGGLPRAPWETFTSCPHEDLTAPSRVHVDPYGHVFLCQGISMGNLWETPLSVLVPQYRAEQHPICGPLVKGGPAALARAQGIIPESGYIDACHLCFLTRRQLLERFPQYLAPRQIYGYTTT